MAEVYSTYSFPVEIAVTMKSHVSLVSQKIYIRNYSSSQQSKGSYYKSKYL